MMLNNLSFFKTNNMKTTLPTLSNQILKWHKQREKEINKFHFSLIVIYNLILEYTQTLLLPLKLEMFIPCKNGVPLEEPKDKELSDFTDEKQKSDWLKQCKEYQQALDRVIFKGFELRITKYKNIYSLFQNGNFITSVNNRKGQKLFGIWKKETISDLCNRVELTDKKYNELNL